MNRTLMLAGASLLTLALVTAAAVAEWNAMLWVAITLLLLTILVLQINDRAVVSERVFAVGRKLERQIKAVEARLPRSGSLPASGAPGGGGMRREKSPRISLDEGVSKVVGSGIFDLEFYSLQANFNFDGVEAAVRHYLHRGRRAGFLPHPLFLPSLVDTEYAKSELDPLVAYIADPLLARGVVTHPFFDPSRLDLAGCPDTITPLAWFLRKQGPMAPLPSSSLVLRSDCTLGDIRASLISSLQELSAAHAHYDPLRSSTEPPEADPALAEMVRCFESGAERPLVSIILPTWNRGGTIRSSIQSVVNQTYGNWELIVADDGSIDDTALVVAALGERDSRVRLVSLRHRGVSAARNAALAAAGGEFVAFLDSDKEWSPDFLMTMVAFLRGRAVEAAVAGCAVSFGNKEVYRSTQPTLESLAIANSVDQTAIVVSRELVLRTGGFDESLRRAVDYDLVLKLAEHTTLHQVPFVGIRYSEDEADPNRISEFETKAWNHHVSDRHAWTAFRQSHDRRRLEEDLLTVIVDDVDDVRSAMAQLEALSVASEGQRSEVVLIPHDGSWALRAALAALVHARLDVRVLTIGFRADRPRYVNSALRIARGASTLIVEASQRLVEGAVSDLTWALRDAAAVQPLVVDETLLISNAGVIYPQYGSDPVPFLRGLPIDTVGEMEHIDTPGLMFPIAARTADLLTVEGATALLDALFADVDLSQKLARLNGRKLVVVPAVKVQQSRRIWTEPRGGARDDIRTFRQLWPVPPSGSQHAMAEVGVDAVFRGFSALSFPDEPHRWTSAILTGRASSIRDRELPLRFAIRTAAPADERAVNWGDYHYAQSLADAFRRAGQSASVDFQPNAERQTAGFEDVVLNLRGLRDIPVPCNVTSVLWVLSHPDMVSAKEVEKYDLVYAASEAWAARQSEQWGTCIRPLLQCTDPFRFHPHVPIRDDLSDFAVMVGNSRRQFRPAAWHAANAGYPIKIWGTLWEDLVPNECIEGQSVPNDQVASLYRSSRWALNDHWPDMRDQGFISNRVFDVLAAGGRLITDDVRGLSQLFGDRVATFRSPKQLLELLQNEPDTVYPPAVLGELSEEVHDLHSFDARVRTIISDVRGVRSVRESRG